MPARRGCARWSLIQRTESWRIDLKRRGLEIRPRMSASVSHNSNSRRNPSRAVRETTISTHRAENRLFAPVDHSRGSSNYRFYLPMEVFLDGKRFASILSCLERV